MRSRGGAAAGAEILEARELLTGYTVNTLSDDVAADGFVSLREAVQAANTNAGVNEAAAGQVGVIDEIRFDGALAGGTIVLGGTELAAAGDLTIVGLGANRLAVSGNNQSRVFAFTSTVTVQGLTITGGNVPAGDGGGLRCTGELILIDCAVTGNRARSGGGASGDVTATGCLFSNNVAIVGGGGGISTNGVVRLSNCTLSGNTADDVGGGIAAFPGSHVSLRNVTVFGNRAEADGGSTVGGGGFYYSSLDSPVVYNSLFAGNVSGSLAGALPDDIVLRSGSPLVTGTNNFVGDAGSAGGLRNGRDGNITGADWRAVLDPVLRNNGGLTKTHRLLPGSAAIDAGSNAQALDPQGQPLRTDQRGRGFARVLQARVDLGAFEAAPMADLVGYLNGGWWVGASTGTAFDTSLWASWADYPWDALGQADFTGDGRADVFGLVDGAWWVGVSTGTAFSTSRWTVWSNLDWQDVKAADLNADGKADVLARVGGNWWAALSTGTGFAAPKLWASWANLEWREFFTLELSADGRADLLGYAHGQWWAGFNQNTNTFSAPVLLGTWSDAAWQKLLVLDADGDGRSDVAGLLGGNWWIGQTIATEFETFFQTRRWAGWSNVVWSDPVSGDFDGDGLDDVAARNGGSWWVGLSTGAAFAAPRLWAGWSNAAWQDVRAADFDGDGLDDLAGRLNGQWWVGRSTGAAFTTSLWGTWSDVAWRAVGAVDVTGPPGGAAASGSASSGSVSAASFKAAATRPADDEPLALFWSKAREDDELASGLLAAG